jgi:undecaprenyl-diphosphatase
MWRSLTEREIAPENTDAKLGWLLVVGTVPAGVLGLLLQDPLRSVFASGRSAAFFLILNGIMLHGAERRRRRAPVVDSSEDAEASDARVATTTSYRDAFGIGAAQAIALIPGFSRSGASMSGGLLVGLSNEDAARFSFLLATPIIGAAALLKLPDLFGPTGDGVRGPALAASLCSAVTAWFSVKFLVKYFETNRLTPFAIYCLIAGIGCSIYLGWIK